MFYALDRVSGSLYSFFVILGSVQVALLLVISKWNKRQASLQAFLSRPWVEVGGWIIRTEQPHQVHGEADPQSGQPLERPKDTTNTLSLGIRFEILNRGAFPLDVDSVEILVGWAKRGDWQWTEFRDHSGLVLRPHSPTGENSEARRISLDLESDEILVYAQNGLYMQIHVKIFYLDTESKRARQDFSVDVVVRAGMPAAFSRPIGRKIKKMEKTSVGVPPENDFL